jgi:hypothetical protein
MGGQVSPGDVVADHGVGLDFYEPVGTNKRSDLHSGVDGPDMTGELLAGSGGLARVGEVCEDQSGMQAISMILKHRLV